MSGNPIFIDQHIRDGRRRLYGSPLLTRDEAAP
jgi:hypothetical protein